MRASQTMTRDVITAPPELSLRAAWAAMKKHQFRHLPVVANGKLRGILSDRDVLLHARLVNGAMELPRVELAAVMTWDPVTCRPETTVEVLALTMLQRTIDALPITEPNGRLVGLVTTADLLGLLTGRKSPKALPFSFQLRGVDLRGDVAAAAAG